MKLTERQIIHIIQKGRISMCTDDERKQVFAFAFGEEFMASKDKGQIKTYVELKPVKP